MDKNVIKQLEDLKKQIQSHIDSTQKKYNDCDFEIVMLEDEIKKDKVRIREKKLERILKAQIKALSLIKNITNRKTKQVSIQIKQVSTQTNNNMVKCDKYIRSILRAKKVEIDKKIIYWEKKQKGLLRKLKLERILNGENNIQY